MAAAFLINQADGRSPVAVSDLAATVQLLKTELERRAGTAGVIETDCSVHRGLAMLGSALRCSIGGGLDSEVTQTSGGSTQLNYYRNSISHWFVADVLVLAALWATATTEALGAAALQVTPSRLQCTSLSSCVPTGGFRRCPPATRPLVRLLDA